MTTFSDMQSHGERKASCIWFILLFDDDEDRKSRVHWVSLHLLSFLISFSVLVHVFLFRFTSLIEDDDVIGQFLLLILFSLFFFFLIWWGYNCTVFVERGRRTLEEKHSNYCCITKSTYPEGRTRRLNRKEWSLLCCFFIPCLSFCCSLLFLIFEWIWDKKKLRYRFLRVIPFTQLQGSCSTEDLQQLCFQSFPDSCSLKYVNLTEKPHFSFLNDIAVVFYKTTRSFGNSINNLVAIWGQNTSKSIVLLGSPWKDVLRTVCLFKSCDRECSGRQFESLLSSWCPTLWLPLIVESSWRRSVDFVAV